MFSVLLRSMVHVSLAPPPSMFLPIALLHIWACASRTPVFLGTLAFLDVRGESMGMELPSKTPDGGRLLRDLRGLPKSEVR